MADFDLIVYAVCAVVAIFALITIFVPDAWGDMTDIEPVALPLLDYTMQPAATHWAAVGRTAPCRSQMYLYTETGPLARDVAARGDVGGCGIYWNRSWLRGTLRDAYDPWRALQRQGLEDLCQTAAHERGHNLGLQHTDNGGLMDPDAGATIPECRSWASAIIAGRRKHCPRRPLRCVTKLTQRGVDATAAIR